MLIVLQQPPRLHLQPICDTGKFVDRNIPLRALDPAEIGPIDIAFVGQSLLAEAARGPYPRLDVFTQPRPEAEVDVLSCDRLARLTSRSLCATPVTRGGGDRIAIGQAVDDLDSAGERKAVHGGTFVVSTSALHLPKAT
jgi:hypothetical protein